MNAQQKLWIAIGIVISLCIGGCGIIKETNETTSSVTENAFAVEDPPDIAPDDETFPEGDDSPEFADEDFEFEEAPAAAMAKGLAMEAEPAAELDWSAFDAQAASESALYGMGMLGASGGGAGLGGFGAGGFGGGGSPSRFSAAIDTGFMLPELNENEFRSFQPNQFNNVLNSPFSTFGADVDTASYSIFRYYVQRRKERPDNQLMRTEEMLNYFKYDYPAPKEGEPFSITTELIQTPWNKGTQLLLIGMQAPRLKETPRSNIVFLIDVSGSMDENDKLPLLQSSILAALDSFTEQDTISIVTYANEEKLILSGASPVRDRNQIQTAINSLYARGGTYGERGLEMAYEQAVKYFIPGGNNRIIMGTDGDLNVGISSENELKAYVEKKRDQGIFLSILGFGFGNLKDNRMEALADNGNGSYHYIDTIEEATRVLVYDRDSTLFTSAKDVKFQIDFNPAKVKGYRLIGYETRKLNTEDFKDDKKDGGEIGAGQQMTALYEIVPAGSEIEVAQTNSAYQKTEIVPSDELATLAVRYKTPDQNTSREIKYPIPSQVGTHPSDNILFAAAVAEVGMVLNNSDFKGNATFKTAYQLLKPLNSVESDPYRTEFLQMVRQLPKLESQAEKQKREHDEYLKQQEEYQKRLEERRKYGTPVVEMSPPEVTGSIDKRIIKKVVRQHIPELSDCYERELSGKSTSGKITLAWVITPQGNVDRVLIKESTLKHKKFEKCVADAVKYWRFPSPKGGGTALIESPFTFERKQSL